MLYGIKIEICAGSIDDVKIADKYSEVDRLEVNSHLEEDGLSMSREDFLTVRQMTKKQVFPMVRLRAGNFIYTDEEKRAMKEEAAFFLDHQADGIVFGSITEDHLIDVPFTKEMIELAHTYHKEAVFHKAFDATNDLIASAKILADLHCDRILTSASCPDCYQGMPLLKLLNEQYGSQIQILPGGGINSTNVMPILQITGITRFHMSLRSSNPEQKLIDVLEAIREEHFQHQHVLTSEDEAMFEEDHYEESMMPEENTHDHE